MGKSILIFILAMLAVNGFWYCSTQQETITQTPAIIFPIVASIALGAFLFWFISDNWDE